MLNEEAGSLYILDGVKGCVTILVRDVDIAAWIGLSQTNKGKGATI